MKVRVTVTRIELGLGGCCFCGQDAFARERSYKADVCEEYVRYCCRAFLFIVPSETDAGRSELSRLARLGVLILWE